VGIFKLDGIRVPPVRPKPGKRKRTDASGKSLAPAKKAPLKLSAANKADSKPAVSDDEEWEQF
jgi:hypothetical protein